MTIVATIIGVTLYKLCLEEKTKELERKNSLELSRLSATKDDDYLINEKN